MVVASSAVVPCAAWHRATCRRRVGAFHDVAPAAAVHVQVDEAGQHEARADSRTALSSTGVPDTPSTRPAASNTMPPSTNPAGVRMWPLSVRFTREW